MNTEATVIPIYTIQNLGQTDGCEAYDVITTTLPEGLRPPTTRDEYCLTEGYECSEGPTFVYQKQLTMEELAQGITLYDLRGEIIGVIG